MSNNKSRSTEVPRFFSIKVKEQTKHLWQIEVHSFLPPHICLVFGCAAVSHTCVAESGGGCARNTLSLKLLEKLV